MDNEAKKQKGDWFYENRERLYCRLEKGGKKKRNIDFLREDYLDMEIGYYLRIGIAEDEFLMMPIKKDYMRKWNADLEDIRKAAWENTFKDNEPEIIRLDELLKEVGGVSYDKECCVYVITNRNRNFGALCILYPDLLKKTADELDGDIFILPSSVHECLAIKAGDGLEASSLRKLVTEINRTELKPEEVLSNSVYRYSRIEQSLSIDNS
ncbi:MAG: DUF5688 family protein [Lachnospiraceae bacterium]|nr:DUF5688 family protein [Lachnospiraceae bacterium]MDY6221119.1 DUF5688 family protein [Candidatus Alectryocaccobium sp.]